MVRGRIDYEELSEAIGTVRGNNLDRQQLEAVVCDCKTELVVAGAGTGKTTTLVGKLKYLVKVKGIPLGKILVISYSNNTVSDLRKAIRDEFGEECEPVVKTIHSYCSSVLKRKIVVGERRSNLIYGISVSMASGDVSSIMFIIDFIKDLNRVMYPDTTYNREYIQNRGLKAVANILFENGVEYRYRPSRISEDGTYDNDSISIGKIVIGRGSELAKNALKDPFSVISYIRDNGVDSAPLSRSELARALLVKWRHEYTDAVGSVISRCKSTGISFNDLRSANDRMNKDSKHSKVADKIDLIERVNVRYSEEYRINGVVDYDDMLIFAAKRFADGPMPGETYDYVLMDEYQDVSKTIIDVLKNMRRRMGFRLFCVGDDWQSIYAFRGSDISLMYDFDIIWKEWGAPEMFSIETTYRCPKGIIDAANKFVMKNPKQLRKSLKSGIVSESRFPISMLQTVERYDIPKFVANRLDNLPKDSTVFVIGRTNNDVYALHDGDNRFSIMKTNDDEQKSRTMLRFKRKSADENGDETEETETIPYLTAHSSKGLEADYVFLIADRDKRCFPNTVDDDISALFPRMNEGIDYPEERRLFYVAMTRARKGLFIITRNADHKVPYGSDSEFVAELIEGRENMLRRTSPLCPKCGRTMKIVTVNGDRKYACSMFPKCNGAFKPYESF